MKRLALVALIALAGCRDVIGSNGAKVPLHPAIQQESASWKQFGGLWWTGIIVIKNHGPYAARTTLACRFYDDHGVLVGYNSLRTADLEPGDVEQLEINEQTTGAVARINCRFK